MVRLMAMPGKMAIHGACSKKVRLPTLSIPPQVGVGGGGPRPRKLSDDSTRIAVPSDVEAMTMIGAITLGSRCWKTIRPPPAPRQRAAST